MSPMTKTQSLAIYISSLVLVAQAGFNLGCLNGYEQGFQHGGSLGKLEGINKTAESLLGVLKRCKLVPSGSGDETLTTREF